MAAAQQLLMSYGGSAANGLLVNLVSYWKMDEASGTRVDERGSYNLTATGTVNDVSGVLNNAALIDAAGKYLTGSSSILGDCNAAGGLTVNLWIKPTSFGGYRSVMDCAIDAFFTGRRLSFFIDSSTIGYWTSRGSGASTDTPLTFSTGFTTGAWQMLTITIDGTTANIYRNASIVATIASGVDVPSAAPFTLGDNPSSGGSRYDGAYDEGAVWKRVLSTGDITNLYNSGSALPYSSFTS